MRTKILILTVLVVLLVGCQRTKETKPLRVGVTSDWPPLAFVDEKGRPAGLDADLVLLLSERLEVPVELVPVPFRDLSLRLQSGELDCIAGWTEVEGPVGTVLSEPYLVGGLTAIVRSDDEAESFNAIVSEPLGLVSGHEPDHRLERIADVVTDRRWFSTSAEALTALRSGAVRAVILDRYVAHHALGGDEDGLRSLGTLITVQYHRIAIGRGWTHLLPDINRELERFRYSRSYRDLVDRWLSRV